MTKHAKNNKYCEYRYHIFIGFFLSTTCCMRNTHNILLGSSECLVTQNDLKCYS